MTCLSKVLALTTALVALPFAAQAQNWTLSGEGSHIAFGSVKKNTAGEIHGFTALSGSVDETGAVAIEIDLTSVETNIDIRNERMIEHVFGKDNPKATLKAQLEPGSLADMKPGDTQEVDVEAVLSFVGKDVPVETTLFVARLGADRAMVTTDSMIMLSTEDLGVDGGIDTLMDLAKLPGITRISPVTVRLMFDRGGEATKAAAEPATQEKARPVEVASAAVSGDAKKGKKVFNRCKACHVADKVKNRVGPHLKGVLGRKAGAVEGFKYSDAMAGSDITWTVETLSAYLANPKDYIPGNKMAFAGLRKDDQIADVIAYMDSVASE